MAGISVDDLTFRHLDIFVEKVRSHSLNISGVADRPNAPIFPALNGKCQNQTNITNSLTKMFKETGFKHRVSCTSLRHTTTQI